MEQKLNSIKDEVDLLDYYRVIKSRKKMISCFVGAITLLTVIISLLMPKYYKAEAVIMPIGKSSGGGGLAALAGQFGGLASLAGLGGAGMQTPSQQFMALLKTRTMADLIMDKYNLLPVILKRPGTNDALNKEVAVSGLLGKYVKFMEDKKSGVIKITAEFKDPKLAADVVNGYVDGLQKFINENAFTVSKRNRMFIEKQLEQNKRELLEAGKELNEFYKGERVSSVEGRIDVPVGGEMSRIQEKDSKVVADGLEPLLMQKGAIEEKLLVKGVPQQVYLQYMTLRRNLLSQINGLLTSQYEMAKTEEAKDELAFQTIDPARVPESRSRPKRIQMVMMAFVASLFIGVFGAFFMEYVEKMKAQKV